MGLWLPNYRYPLETDLSGPTAQFTFHSLIPPETLFQTQVLLYLHLPSLAITPAILSFINKNFFFGPSIFSYIIFFLLKLTYFMLIDIFYFCSGSLLARICMKYDLIIPRIASNTIMLIILNNMVWNKILCLNPKYCL